VIGHQWWWEFRYPQYTTRNAATGRVDTLVTANELYLPKGRTVNFSLRTEDVIHSFWIPRLGGKRDMVANHTNYLWFTPVDSIALPVLHGKCTEYCGESHANMQFRTFVVDTAQFASWVAGQLRPAALGAVPAPAATQAAVPRLEARARAQGGTPAEAGGVAVVTRDRPATQREQSAGQETAARQNAARAATAQAGGAPGAGASALTSRTSGRGRRSPPASSRTPPSTWRAGSRTRRR
jgi:hypothetical protein